MLKKTLFVLCAGMMTVALIGCASPSSAPTDDSSNTPPASSSEAPTENTNTSTGNSNTNNNASSANQLAQSASITEDEAKAAALSHAGLEAAAATFTDIGLDYENGVLVYEIDIVSGDREYDYDINATDGSVVSWSNESIYD